MSIAQYERWFITTTGMWCTEHQSCFAFFICYYPGFDVGKGLVPDLWFHLVSSAPAAVETIVLDVKEGQSAPQGPLKNSRRIAAGRGHSHCCCPEGEPGSVSFASDQD